MGVEVVTLFLYAFGYHFIIPCMELVDEDHSDASHKRCGLVVLYNHNYEKNISVIRSLYQDRFSQLVQLMPFYYGNEDGVLPVFGNSFCFHSYIAQVKEYLMQMPCDRFLIIGDDLLLNPEINEYNVDEVLTLSPEAVYIDGFNDVSQAKCYRGTREAHCFSMWPPGLDGSANRILPSYDQAFEILHAQGLMETTALKYYRPFLPQWKLPMMRNVHDNWHIFKARVFHLRYTLLYRLFPKKASYPVVFGYSDILSVPKSRLLEWISFLEVFATWNMFVELAIPTAFALLPNVKIVTNDDLDVRSGNVWYPQDPEHFDHMNEVINGLIHECHGDPEQISRFYPKEYLYLHPVKLSQFKR